MSVFRKSYPSKRVPALTNNVDFGAPVGFVSSVVFNSITALFNAYPTPADVLGQRALYRDGGSVLVAVATNSTWFPDGGGVGRDVMAVWFQEAEGSIGAVLGFFLRAGSNLADGDIGVGLRNSGTDYQKYFYKYSLSLDNLSANGFYKVSFRDTNVDNLYIGSELEESDITAFNSNSLLPSQDWTVNQSAGSNTIYSTASDRQRFQCGDAGGRIIAYKGTDSYKRSLDVTPGDKRIFLRISNLDITVSDTLPSVSDVAFLGCTITGLNGVEKNLLGIIYDHVTGDWILSDDARTQITNKVSTIDLLELCLYESSSNRLIIDFYLNGSLDPSGSTEITNSGINTLIEVSDISLPVITDSKGIFYNHMPSDVGFTESVLTVKELSTFVLDEEPINLGGGGGGGDLVIGG
jgi:hypothetical protein